MKKLMIMAALPVLAMAAPQVAMAEESRTAYVSYAGLDLTTEAGQKELQGRIEHAVNTVCSDGRTDLSASEVFERGICKKFALKKSRQQYATVVSNARYGG